MYRVISNDPYNIEGFLDSDVETFRNQSRDVFIYIFPSFSQMDAEFLDA